jgi:hypothetical protein
LSLPGLYSREAGRYCSSPRLRGILDESVFPIATAKDCRQMMRPFPKRLGIEAFEVADAVAIAPGI